MHRSKTAPLIDHLVGERKQLRWKMEAEPPSRSSQCPPSVKSRFTRRAGRSTQRHKAPSVICQFRKWRQISRRPCTKTRDQLKMQTERRNQVGQNESPFTSASPPSRLSASPSHSPPAGSPDGASNGPAALIRAAFCSRNER